MRARLPVLGVAAVVAVMGSAALAGSQESLVVTTAADVVADDGLCSLREAITAANTDTASGGSVGECPAGSGADTVTFGVAGPFVLTLGQLEVTSDVTIDGGSPTATIDAFSEEGRGRVVDVGTAGDATLRSLVITGGDTEGAEPEAEAGGGIRNSGSLLVENSTIERNWGGDGPGGGIANVGSGSVIVVNSTISHNSTDGAGAGIANLGGGSVIVFGSTISGNETINYAGGILNGEGSSMIVVNSTVSGNGAIGTGGIDSAGSLTVAFSTVTDNGVVAWGFAGGIGAGPDAVVTASIVAGNYVTDGGGDVLGEFSSGGYNVIGEGSTEGFTGPGDVVDVVDPGLAPLANYGGPTATHALQTGSPALDRVTAPVAIDPTIDQRGVARPQGPAKDAGAFEVEMATLTPGAAGFAEGNGGSKILEIPITLSAPVAYPVTVDYVSWPCERWEGCGDGWATQGVDYADPTPGTLTFLPGETTKTVPVTVYGDTDPEPSLLWGEWFFIKFQDPTGAVLDTSFFGLGIGIIGEDDGG